LHPCDLTAPTLHPPTALFSHPARPNRDLPSFPTRRSSDLKQHSLVPDDEEITAADRLIVESPTLTGLILVRALVPEPSLLPLAQDRKSTRLNSSHVERSYAVFCL